MSRVPCDRNKCPRDPHVNNLPYRIHGFSFVDGVPTFFPLRKSNAPLSIIK